MTDVHRLRRGEVRLLHGSDRDRGDSLAAVVPVHVFEPAVPAASNSNNLGNVVPFMRPRSVTAQAPDVVLPVDVARPPAGSLARERARLLSFVALSLLIHGAFFKGFWREPEPLASIGVQSISAEIVLGASAPAGAAPTPGEQQQDSPSTVAPEKPVEQVAEAQTAATEQPQDVKIAAQESAPEQKTEPKAEENTTTPQETQPAEQKPAVAMVESPNADTATAAPREVPPDATELSLLPQPEKPVEPTAEAKPVPKAEKAAPPKPVKNAAPAKEPRRINAPTKEHATRQAKVSTPSTAANNVGVGRSDASSNYPGLVSAHLRRYQQYPSDARGAGQQGTATVSFSIDSGGRVTSARLARGSGVASIDAEVQSMVRRASPFPAPPAGAPHSFTVPVSFRLN